MMLVARGVPALMLYMGELPLRQRVALAFHSGTQLPLVVAIATITVHQGAMRTGAARRCSWRALLP